MDSLLTQAKPKPSFGEGTVVCKLNWSHYSAYFIPPLGRVLDLACCSHAIHLSFGNSVLLLEIAPSKEVLSRFTLFPK